MSIVIIQMHGIRDFESPSSNVFDSGPRNVLPLAAKPIVPTSAGTLPTHGLQFVGLPIGTAVIVGALTFFLALALGPIAEEFTLWAE